MANEEQLSILKQGVEVWNKWREDNPGAQIDLTGANLREADLHDVDLSKADLSGADLHHANICGAKLWRAYLGWAILTEADLSRANLAAPVSKNRQSTQSQRRQQRRFKQAVAYACEAAKTEPIYAELAQRTNKTAYNIAMSDWFHAPVIHDVSRRSGRIRIDASDHVHVANVRVTILDEAGNSLEQGTGALVNAAWWEYETETQGNILVEASDLAGNVTRQEA